MLPSVPCSFPKLPVPRPSPCETPMSPTRPRPTACVQQRGAALRLAPGCAHKDALCFSYPPATLRLCVSNVFVTMMPSIVGMYRSAYRNRVGAMLSVKGAQGSPYPPALYYEQKVTNSVPGTKLIFVPCTARKRAVPKSIDFLPLATRALARVDLLLLR